MKINICIFILFLFAQSANSQIHRSIELAGGDSILMLSDVQNGFTREVPFLHKENLSTFYGVAARVTNTGVSEFRIEGWLNTTKWCGSGIYVKPGESKTIQLFIYRSRPAGLTAFTGMKGLPGGTVSLSPIDPANVSKMTFIVYTGGKASLSVSRVRTYGQYINPQVLSDSPGFYPFIDEFGQYKHGNWPGKTGSVSELEEAAGTEEQDLFSKPGPSDRDRFGGWANGPDLAATGHFRTEKVNGKWWLVDPDGHLFWSHGITCIGFAQGATRITGRNNYFESLPGRNDPEAVFYSKSGNDTLFNFLQLNLYRKYGSQWKAIATRNIVRRLTSWGMNTYGNWSDSQIYLYAEDRIPYTVGVSSGSSNISFPDVFDPAFRSSVTNALNRLDAKVINDPYCIGFFIDNELKITDITGQVMLYSSDNKTKLEFINFLQQKYSSIGSLNNSWSTSYTSFSFIGTVTSLPSSAKQDKHAFDIKVMDTYYRICSEELKSFAPKKIYFGSRLTCHYFPDYDLSEIDFINAAVQYCDVVCFNRYRFSAIELMLPFNADKPVIIGEFHFGAHDRGLCYAGMRNVADQNQRADAYYGFVKEALDNPQIVGTHWFQYSDLPYTGRSLDGANAQVGFIDICDNPYPETVEAARKIGYPIYEIRYGGPSETSRNNYRNNGFTIFPNPASGHFNLRFYQQGDGEVIMSLYTANGSKIGNISKVFRGGINNWEITQQLPEGIYLITLEKNSRIATCKLIVN